MIFLVTTCYLLECFNLSALNIHCRGFFICIFTLFFLYTWRSVSSYTFILFGNSQHCSQIILTTFAASLHPSLKLFYRLWWWDYPCVRCKCMCTWLNFSDLKFVKFSGGENLWDHTKSKSHRLMGRLNGGPMLSMQICLHFANSWKFHQPLLALWP